MSPLENKLLHLYARREMFFMQARGAQDGKRKGLTFEAAGYFEAAEAIHSEIVQALAKAHPLYRRAPWEKSS